MVVRALLLVWAATHCGVAGETHGKGKGDHLWDETGLRWCIETAKGGVDKNWKTLCCKHTCPKGILKDEAGNCAHAAWATHLNLRAKHCKKASKHAKKALAAARKVKGSKAEKANAVSGATLAHDYMGKSDEPQQRVRRIKQACNSKFPCTTEAAVCAGSTVVTTDDYDKVKHAAKKWDVTVANYRDVMANAIGDPEESDDEKKEVVVKVYSGEEIALSLWLAIFPPADGETEPTPACRIESVQGTQCLSGTALVTWAQHFCVAWDNKAKLYLEDASHVPVRMSDGTEVSVSLRLLYNLWHYKPESKDHRFRTWYEAKGFTWLGTTAYGTEPEKFYDGAMTFSQAEKIGFNVKFGLVLGGILCDCLIDEEVWGGVRYEPLLASLTPIAGPGVADEPLLAVLQRIYAAGACDPKAATSNELCDVVWRVGQVFAAKQTEAALQYDSEPKVRINPRLDRAALASGTGSICQKPHLITAALQPMALPSCDEPARAAAKALVLGAEGAADTDEIQALRMLAARYADLGEFVWQSPPPSP